MNTKNLLGEASWPISNDRVSAHVTRAGGHLGPVEFLLGGRSVSPFHVAPWAGERGARGLPPVLRVLRGDFFCMPFGGNAEPWRGERHPVHGETANAEWRREATSQSGKWTGLHLSLDPGVRSGRVEKTISLRSGDPAIYSRHVISGMRGPMPLGHHAMLAFEEGEEARISTSPIFRGQVYPGVFEDPALGGYSSLKKGALFRALSRVPLADGGNADLSRYPAREGFEDLVMVSSRPGEDFGWSAAVIPGRKFLWFSLKDPRVLASTVLWHSNGGRHYAPWCGRQRRVLGIEEVTSYFHEGIASSAKANPVSRAGIPTCLHLDPSAPLVVNTIMGVAALPKGFEEVREIRRTPRGIRIISGTAALEVPLDTGFLSGNEKSG